ncbi:hypothetical protein D9M69_474720 [compost metagenome]
MEVIEVLRLLLEPLVDGSAGAQPLGHIPGLILQVQHYLVGHRLVEFVGVDVGAEHVSRHLLVFTQQGRAGKTDEDRPFQPALHLFIHVAALSAVAFIDKDVEAAMDTGRFALQVGGVEFVDQGAE